MKNFLTNETNLESLKEAVSKAKERIFIISPWIRSETFKKVFNEEILEKIKNENIKVYIVIRLSSMDDIKFTDEEFFNIVEKYKDNFLLRYNKDLHAKFYIIDNFYASVGSYNLTGGGFGDQDKKGKNIEAGVEIKDADEINSLIILAESIWDNSCEISEDLLGFTLNETTHYRFIMAGIRPLESGKFIEIREKDNEIILGQIGLVKKYNFSFFSEPSIENFQEDLIDTFSNTSELANKIKGIINSTTIENGQLNIGVVNIIGRFYLEDENGKIKVKREDNKIAPDVGKEVFIATPKILEDLFSNEHCTPAVLYSNREVRAGFNIDEIISKHMAVFGTTGSGKSFFVKYLTCEFLYKYLVLKKGARIIIFDPHGEYEDEIAHQSILKYNNFFEKGYLTKYIIDSDDFLMYFGIKGNTKAGKKIIEIFQNEDVNNSNIVNLLKKEDETENLASIVNEAIINKEISFTPPPEIWKDFENPGIYCLNFDDISEIEVIREIAGNIMNSVFQRGKSDKNFPTLFIVEEAHNFAPEGEGKNNIAGVAMRQIAREGRKFNIGMIVITQRPAYVSKDVLSQCSTQAIFRLINTNDIGQVADVVEGISKEELVRLPHYVQGQCIFTGVGIETPVVVKVQK